MLISHTHRFIYIVVPRTASTSTAAILRSTLKPGVDETRIPVHARAKRVREFFPREWESYSKIANIRHPYTRSLSIFSYWLGDFAPQALREKICRNSAPHLWTEEYELFLREKKFPLMWEEKEKGYYFLDDAPIDIQLIRYENLRDSLRQVSHRFNLALDIENNLPWHANYGAKKRRWNILTLMNANAKAFIDEHYAWYFERFGYKKEIEDAA